MPFLGLIAFLASWNFVFADFDSFASLYNDTTSANPGFLVEYFTVSSVPQQVFADMSCATCATCLPQDSNCATLCKACPGLAQYESKYASAGLGSLSSRSWVRMSATVAPALEFKTPSLENTSGITIQDVSGEEWYGFYYPRQEKVFDLHPVFQQRSNWGIRASGRMLLYSNLATRLRVQVQGRCYNYSLRVGNSNFSYSNTDVKDSDLRQEYDVPLGDPSPKVVFEIRFNCAASASSNLGTVKGFNIRWIYERWRGPSRVFLLNQPLPGNSGLSAFDQKCQLAGSSSPSVGTWKALLWTNATDQALRFPANQFVTPLLHPNKNSMFALGSLSMRQSVYSSLLVANDLFGARQGMDTDAIWIASDDGVNCGGWTNATTGNVTTVGNTSFSGWRTGSSASCSESHMFYCAEVFSSTGCSSVCRPDVIPCPGVCKTNEPCRTDRDCETNSCQGGMCRGLILNALYCTNSVAACPCSSHPGYRCEPSTSKCIIGNATWNVTENTSCDLPTTGSFYIKAAVTHTGSLPADDPCPPGYFVTSSTNNGTACNASQTAPGCCGFGVTCNGTDCDLSNLRPLLRPAHSIVGISIARACSTVGDCVNQCFALYGDCGSVAHVQGDWYVSRSRVLTYNASLAPVGGVAWVVVAGADRFVPLSSINLQHRLPSHTIPTASVRNVYDFLTSAGAGSSVKPIFKPSSGTFAGSVGFFCVFGGVQCWNTGEDRMVEQEELTGYFSLLLPMWGLAGSPAQLTIPPEMIHLDLSINPMLQLNATQPLHTMGSIELLGIQGINASCSWNTSIKLPSRRLAVADDWCIKDFTMHNFSSVQHFILHQRVANVNLSVGAPSLQTFGVLNGNFPGQTNGSNLSCSFQPNGGLANVIVINANLSTDPMNTDTMQKLGLHGISPLLFNDYKGKFPSLTNLTSLEITDITLNLEIKDLLPALKELVVQGSFPVFTLSSSSAPQLTKLVANLGRDTSTPVSEFLTNLSCCGNRPTLTYVDFSDNKLYGALVAGSFNMSQMEYLNLAYNYLNPFHPDRSFGMDNSSAMTEYLQAWSMLPDWQNNTNTKVVLNVNPLLSGNLPTGLSCTSSNCPDTALCSPTYNSSCTSFWLIDYWISGVNVFPTVPVPSSHSAVPSGKFRLNVLIYGNLASYQDTASRAPSPFTFHTPVPMAIPVVATTLFCQIGAESYGGNQTLFALPTNVSNVFLGMCVFDVTVPSPTPGLTTGAITVGVANTSQLQLNKGNSFQDSSSWQLYVQSSACPPGTFFNSTACEECPAGKFGLGGSGPCVQCSAGFVSGPGDDVCMPCPSGTQSVCPNNVCQCQPCPGGSFNSLPGSTCQACPAGTRSGHGASVCSNCPAGQTSLSNSTDCVDCFPGTFSLEGDSNCTGCFQGRFQDHPGNATCLACSVGTEALQVGMTSCTFCQRGTFRSDENTTACSQCDIGHYQPSIGQTACLGCAAGTYSDKPGQAVCTDCTTGKFSSTTNSTSCMGCREGTAQSQPGMTNCTECTAGKAAPAGSNSCDRCSFGKYSEARASSCTSCEPGRAMSGWSATACLNCTAGSVAVNSGQVTCNPCTVGRYIDVEGGSECTLCEEGKYQDMTNQTECVFCPDGSDSRVTGSPACTPCLPGRAGFNCTACVAGKFQSRGGQLDCVTCALGKYADPPQSGVGATSCLDCPIGKFGSDSTLPRTNEACTNCPPHSTSEAGTDSIDKCTCMFGFYGDNNGTGGGPVCTACPGCAVCPGGANLTSPAGCYLLTPAQTFESTNGQQSSYAAVLCAPAEACLADSVCAPAYTGELCHSCQTHHYRVNGKCAECPDLAGAFWALMILLLFVITLGLLRFSRPSLSKINSLGIFLSGVQIISVFGYIPVEYPDTAKQMFKILSVANFNLDLFSAECSTNMRFYGLWLFKLGLPLFFLGALGVIYVLVRFVPPCRSLFDKLMGEGDPSTRKQVAKLTHDVDESASGENADWSNRNAEEVCAKEYVMTRDDRFVYCIISLMTLLYTFLATTASQPFQCTAVGFQSSLLRDPSELCYTDEWRSYAAVSAIAMIVYTFGFPAILFFLLARGNSQNKLQELEFMARYGALVIPYRSQFFFWAILDMLRKAGVVLCLSFLPGTTRADITLQINLIFLLTFAFLLAQVMTSPFEYNFCNRLCFVWLTATLLTLVSALLFHSPGLAERDRLAYAVFLLIVVLFAIAVTIYVALREIRRAHWRLTMEKRTGVTTMTRRKYQRALLGDVFEGFSHDVWRKMRIYNDEESLKFFHYLARNKVRQDGKAHKLLSKPKNILSDDDLKESDRVANQGAIELVRLGPDAAV